VPLQSGPVFRVTDPHIKLKVDKENPFIAVVSVAEGVTAASFSLTVSGNNKKNGRISSTFVIPIL